MPHIRDPIHSRISLTPAELKLVDHPAYQRLRSIKQLGFTDVAFPGATHTRFAHSLGAMHISGQMFDALFPAEACPFPAEVRRRLRQTIRLALMLHDVGHPPMSHAGEAGMPPRTALQLQCFDEGELQRRASHEDYTLLLLLRSSLREAIEAGFGGEGLHVEDIAHLISGRFGHRAEAFTWAGVDYFPVLSQLVTGEMDADRMDYLQRDAFYAGVSYGRFDQAWLLENLRLHVTDESEAYLALKHRAIFAFEDFLLSRHHMFVSVYYHHVPVGFDHMLMRYYADDPQAFMLPQDPEEYAQIDDVTLRSALRESKHEWARRIDRRRGYFRLFELNDEDEPPDVPAICNALAEAGVDHFLSQDSSTISRYFGRGGHGTRPIFIINKTTGRTQLLEKYSTLYQRYRKPIRLCRLYCHPAQIERAREIARPWLPGAQVWLPGV